MTQECLGNWPFTWKPTMSDLGLNPQLYPVLVGDHHPSDEDAERLFAIAMTDSPWLVDWQQYGGFANGLWASGLEHLLYHGYKIDQTCALGAVMYDFQGWRGTGILQACGHPVEIRGSSGEWVNYFLNTFPFRCGKCAAIQGQMN